MARGCIQWTNIWKLGWRILTRVSRRRSIARDMGLSRWVVDKMCSYPAPQGYQRTKPIVKPKLDGFTGIINHWLESDKSQPRKQRHTAKEGFLSGCGLSIVSGQLYDYQGLRP